MTSASGITEQTTERTQKRLGTSCGANVIPAATAITVWETIEGKRGSSKFFHHAFPKSFPVILQRISSISEDSLGIPSPSFVLIRTSYMVSS